MRCMRLLTPAQLPSHRTDCARAVTELHPRAQRGRRLMGLERVQPCPRSTAAAGRCFTRSATRTMFAIYLYQARAQPMLPSRAATAHALAQSPAQLRRNSGASPGAAPRSPASEFAGGSAQPPDGPWRHGRSLTANVCWGREIHDVRLWDGRRLTADGRTKLSRGEGERWRLVSWLKIGPSLGPPLSPPSTHILRLHTPHSPRPCGPLTARLRVCDTHHARLLCWQSTTSPPRTILVPANNKESTWSSRRWTTYKTSPLLISPLSRNG